MRLQNFALNSRNSSPYGIVYADNRFYVVDGVDDYVYAYTSSGQRDAASDFHLDSQNGFSVWYHVCEQPILCG